MRGVCCESLLLGDMRFEPREHGVEGVGELAELVSVAQPDSVGERSSRGNTRGIRDASEGREHPAGEQPSTQETEHQQKSQHDGCGRSESAQEEGVIPGHDATDGADHTIGYVSQEGVERVPGRPASHAAASIRAPASMRKPA